LHVTDDLSALHTNMNLPLQPQAAVGAPESAPQPPHAFIPGSLQLTEALSAEQT
jgi:hypothetical protein